LPLAVSILLGLGLIGGCSSKGGLEGKVTVKESPQLADLGVTVQDWKYSDQTLSVKLAATKDFGEPWLITVQADNGQPFGMMTPLTLKAGQSEWVSFGGPKFLDRFEIKPDTKKVTVGVRNRMTGR
jgi:hypothetical protein